MELIYTPKAGNDLLRIKERIEEYFDDEEKRMNHNTPLPKEQSKSIPVYRKWWFWLITVIVIAGIAVAGFLLSASKDQKEDQTAPVTEQVKDFSDQDFKDLIGKSEEDLENAGLIKSEDADEYTGLDENLKIVLKDGKVDQIHIAGEPDVTPAFAGVRIGTGGEDAKSTLLAIYPDDTSAEEMIKVSNLDTKESVECDLSDGTVSAIRYFVMTDEQVSEVESKLQEAYIFPDSADKYLSEDEIRSVSVDDMALGRNEIFARHGYIFNEEPFKTYFADQSWYEGTVPSDQFHADQVFNDFEKKNVELIRQIEDEINGAAAAQAEQQNAVNDAYDFLVGHSYNCRGYQTSISFETRDTLVVIYGGEIEDRYTSYSISSRYEVYRDDQKEWLTFVTIDGVEYYLRCFTDGSMNLAGNGEFDGWYDMIS